MGTRNTARSRTRQDRTGQQASKRCQNDNDQQLMLATEVYLQTEAHLAISGGELNEPLRSLLLSVLLEFDGCHFIIPYNAELGVMTVCISP